MFLFRNKTWLYLLFVTLALKMKTTSQDQCFLFPHPLTVFYRQGAKHSLSHSPQRCPCPSTLLTWFRMWTQCSSYYRPTEALFLNCAPSSQVSQGRCHCSQLSVKGEGLPPLWPPESFSSLLTMRSKFSREALISVLWFSVRHFYWYEQTAKLCGRSHMACIIITRWH